MKRIAILTLAISLLLAGVCQATDYYADPASSGGDGTTQETSGAHAAFKTCVAAATALTGDQSDNRLLLKRGSSFLADTLVLTGAGTAGHPFTIDAYGTGANPRIYAAQLIASGIASWTKTGGYTNVYQATTGTAHDESSTWARYAGVWFKEADGSVMWKGRSIVPWQTATGAITGATLTGGGSGYTDGAGVTLTVYQGAGATAGKDNAKVNVDISGGAVTTINSISVPGCNYATGAATIQGNGGVNAAINISSVGAPGLAGVLQLVDTYPGTCWWDSGGGGTIYINDYDGDDPTVAGKNYWVSAYRMGISLTGSYINVNNIDVYYAGLTGIASCSQDQTAFGNHINFTNCNVLYSAAEGFNPCGEYITATDCTSKWTCYGGFSPFSASLINVGFTTDNVTLTRCSALSAITGLMTQFTGSGVTQPNGFLLDFGRHTGVSHKVTVTDCVVSGGGYYTPIYIDHSSDSLIDGISLSATYSRNGVYDTGSSNLTVQRVVQTPTSPSLATHWSMLFSATNGLTVKQNYIYAPPSGSYATINLSSPVGDTIIASNILRGTNLYYNVLLSGLPAAPKVTKFYNNTVYYSSLGLNWGNDAPLEIKNNIFLNTTNILLAPATVANLVCDGNDGYNYNAAQWGKIGSTFYTLENWRTATSQDANSIKTNPAVLNASGQLNTATDFKVPPTSGCVRHGVAVTGITTYYDGYPIAGTPNIGAWGTPSGGGMGLGLTGWNFPRRKP